MKKNLDSNISQFEVGLESVRTLIILFNYGIISWLGKRDLKFLVTFVTSLLTAGLGMAKCLKLGVARIMGEGGPVDGLLSGQFILTVIACLGGLGVKCFFLILLPFEGPILPMLQLVNPSFLFYKPS